MDYADLRAEGIRQLERMAGGSWTDFNAHDPGITILEQAAYALSDLAYRIGFDVPDLLSTGGADPYGSLYPPHEILPSNPVTPTDLRKLVLDVPGVRNAWIESATDARSRLHYHRPLQELSLEADPPVSEPVNPLGLHRVLIEADDPTRGVPLRRDVARRLYANRPLCEDFVEIRVLPPQEVQVNATLEIGPVDDPDIVLLDVLERISDTIAPPVRFTELDQAARDGTSIEEIFDGPRLRHGYLDADQLRTTERRTALRTSDLVQAVTAVPGVRGITRISLTTGGVTDPWSIDLDPDSTPHLDLERSTIILTRGNLTARGGIDGVKDEHIRRRTLARDDHPGAASNGAIAEFVPESGRDRAVGHYFSMQHQFPALYGIAEMGLPRSADPARRAQTKQLKAYLLFFDQVLANMFAQLAHVGDLFSFRSESNRTYFASAIDDERLGLDDVRIGDLAEHAARIAELTDHPDEPDGGRSAASAGRRERFLNHLLARFAERLSDAALVGGEELEAQERRHVAAREAFLERYPRVSAARGGAADDLLAPSSFNESGLAERVRLKLGLVRDAGEEFALVEHLLLRPMAGDEEQHVPVLTDAEVRDPYSLQVSFVFAASEGRMRNEEFRQLVHHTVRSETPAHLVAHVKWLDPDEWATFRTADAAWRDHRRRTLAAEFLIDIEPEE